MTWVDRAARPFFDRLYGTPGSVTPAQSGMLGWTSDPASGGTVGVSILAASQTWVSRIVADTTGTANYVLMAIDALGSGLSTLTFQLMDSTGARIATTGDVKASFQSPAAVGGKKIPFTTGVPVIAGNTYYVTATGAGGTGPTVARGSFGTDLGTDILPNQRYGKTSDTSAPSSITPASLVATTYFAFWFGLKT